MSTWGLGIFENDDAMDWVYELQESDDLSLVESALDTLIGGIGDYLDAYDCAVALAAAEVVAALVGNPFDDLPEEVADWVDRQQENGALEIDTDLVRRSVQGVDAVVGESELKELWVENEELESWYTVVDDLLERLRL